MKRLLGAPARWSRSKLLSLVEREAPRAKKRITRLQKRFPNESPRELARRLVEDKKKIASAVGGVTGLFGVASLPADLATLAWLQLRLFVELALIFGTNLKAERTREELLELFFHATGLGPLQRAAPRVMGQVAVRLFEKGGMKLMGRAVPLVSGPISAYLNNEHIQAAGDEAIHFYGGFGKIDARARKRDSVTDAQGIS